MTTTRFGSSEERKTLQRDLAHYKEKCQNLYDELNKVKADRDEAWNRHDRIEGQFNEARVLWNQWVYANKGLNSADQLATAQWEIDTFPKLLALLSPIE